MSPPTPFDVVLSPEEERVVARARAFARDHVAPEAGRWERAHEIPVETLRAAAREGLAGLLVPRALGGAGLSYTAAARALEELAAVDMAFAFALVVHNNLAGAVARNGTAKQIERFVPAMLRGERIGAFCLTEPGAGSDAAAIATLARRVDGGWSIDGEKAWVTNGAVADLLSVYAQTDPEKGWRGIACLLVEGEREGIAREPAYALMGGHAMGTAGLRFDGCGVPDDNLLLGPGEAFKAAMAGINIARTFVAAMCCGMVRDALERAIDYASQRTAFGRPTIDFQGVQWMLAEVATGLEAARLLSYRAAALLDAGGDAVAAAAHAKKFATRMALSAVADCMQAMGAAGFKADQPFGRHLTAAKMAQFLDGTTEIQNVVIGRDLLGRVQARAE